MNRELKFRAWHPEWKKFLYFNSLQLQYNGWSYELKTEGNRELAYHIIYDQKENIIQQFTGLKDKNGVEIYEGDIVEMYPSAPFELSKPIVDKVVYSTEDASFCIEGEHFHSLYDGEITVIGNIFETPELLDKKD